MYKNFTKKDLENHMVIELRNKEKFLIAKHDNIVRGINAQKEINVDEYNEDLTKNMFSDDIMKVYKGEGDFYLFPQNWDKMNLIWKR